MRTEFFDVTNPRSFDKFIDLIIDTVCVDKEDISKHTSKIEITQTGTTVKVQCECGTKESTEYVCEYEENGIYQ